MKEKLKTNITICFWCDLLGYASPFVKSNWQLNTPDAIKNLERIESLKNYFTSVYFYPIEKLLVLNDGFIRNVDIVDPNGGPQRYIYWLDLSIHNFIKLNYIDNKNGYPGARGVITVGQRFTYMPDIVTASDIVQASPEKKEKLNSEIIVYSPQEFQMNTAFSKAYIMENSGSKAGLSGRNLYIDKDFLYMMEYMITKYDAYYLLADFDSLEKAEVGEWVETPLNKKYVRFDVEVTKKDDSFMWGVYQTIDNTRSLLFSIWFDAKQIEYSNQGINTVLYRATKFKPFDDNEYILIE